MFAFVGELFGLLRPFSTCQCLGSESDASGIVKWKRGTEELDLHFFTQLVKVERSQEEGQLVLAEAKTNSSLPGYSPREGYCKISWLVKFGHCCFKYMDIASYLIPV